MEKEKIQIPEKLYEKNTNGKILYIFLLFWISKTKPWTPLITSVIKGWILIIILSLSGWFLNKINAVCKALDKGET